MTKERLFFLVYMDGGYYFKRFTKTKEGDTLPVYVTTEAKAQQFDTVEAANEEILKIWEALNGEDHEHKVEIRFFIISCLVAGDLTLERNEWFVTVNENGIR